MSLADSAAGQSGGVLSNRTLVFAALVFVGGLTVILAALAFEHIGGYIPCALCLQERYAYYAAVPAALLAMLLARTAGGLPSRVLLVLIALAFLANAGLGTYHAGAEWGFWPGPDSCATGGGSLATTADDLMASLTSEKPPSYTEATFRLLGLSFAGWNVVASLGLALAALAGAAASRRARA